MVDYHNFSDINIGDTATYSKTINEADILKFADLTGDYNPIHTDEEFAKGSRFKKRIAHGMFTASLISTIIGTKLPGVNTIYLSQDLKFMAPVYIGDTIIVEVEVVDIVKGKNILTLKTLVKNQYNVTVIEGHAKVMKP